LVICIFIGGVPGYPGGGFSQGDSC
jgi:hypothetical protein